MPEAPADRVIHWKPDLPALIAMLVGSVMIALLLRNAPFLGHDWMFYFVSRVGLDQYPPWIAQLAIGWSALMPGRESLYLLQGMSSAVPAIYTYYVARQFFPESKWPAGAAMFMVMVNPIQPVIWWLAQIEVLSMLGMILLPLGIPLLFAKPHLSPWAIFHSRRAMLWMGLFVLVSLLIWPSWMLDLSGISGAKRFGQPSAMGWLDLDSYWMPLLGIAMFALTDRNPIRLIAAGAFISPFFMPYHVYALLPALGMAKGWKQGLLWALSWLFVLVLLQQSWTNKMLVYLYIFAVWLLLAPHPDPRVMWADPQSIAQRLRRTVREALAIRSWADLKDFVLKDSEPCRVPALPTTELAHGQG